MKRVFALFSLILVTCYVLALSLAEGLFVTPHVLAQDTGWVIDSFHSDNVVMNTGEVVVAEDIAVDFGSLEKHGIYRDLPYVYEGESGEKSYSEIKVNQILQDSHGATYDVTRNESNIRIKIGDANRTISGKHNYQISYTVKGILRGFEGYDELNWNVTGNAWGVPIGKVTSRVSTGNANLTQATCFQGYSSYTDPCTYAIATDKKSVTFTATRMLQPNEGLTIVVGYGKGIIPLIVVERPKTMVEKIFEPSSLVFLGILLAGSVGIAFFLWFRYGRDYSFIRRSVLDKPTGEKLREIGEHETVVVEYEPPEKLRPAEIGVLTDERADTLDVVATIIDLAGRGYLTITELSKKWVFGDTDYLLTMKNFDASGLLPYETLLFDKLFDGKKEVKVSSLKTTFYQDLAQVKKSLYERVVADKFFEKSPEKMRSTYLIAGSIILVLGFITLTYVVNGESAYPVDFGIGVMVLGFFLLVLSPFMSRKTGHGREMYRRVKGYQLFIATAEKYRQRFFEKKNLFNQVLPYAIVFGLTAKFAQAMKDIGLPEKYMASGWYVGAHAFNYATFSSGMNDFSRSLSTAIASSPKSSGFSSGGGSSGGGFGGGGGGSW
ncbi:MAG: DUF2207 domain-containing protein [bacterium]|nr:DUF2207 domain-containing protein [bacterium]